jgi:hypothetical protein
MSLFDKSHGWILWLLVACCVACSPDPDVSGMGARGPSRGGGVSGQTGSAKAGDSNFGNPLADLSAGSGTVVGTASSCRNATIAFLVDGSGSMCEPFGNSTRWTELRNALVAKPAGLVYKLQSVASFGLYIYDGSVDFMLAQSAAPATGGGGGGASMCEAAATFRRMMGMCPQIVEVKPADNNAATIDKMFPASTLGGSTPTDKAMNYLVDQLVGMRTMGSAPQYILLATDGQPNDICTGGMGGDGTAQQLGVVAAVDRAAQAGITTFVISLASDAALQMHLDEVARHGDVRNPMAHSFTPTNSQDLIQTLTTLLGNAIGCPI